MAELVLSSDRIVSLDDCRLCAEGRREAGNIGDRGAVVYKSGTDPAEDWIITLQKKNVSDPERGFTLMLMPVGHLTAFSQVNSNRELAQNYGITFARAHHGMQIVRQEFWKPENGEFDLTAVDYGKCASSINTQEHFHIKAYTFDGSVAQPFPSDTEWGERLTFHDENSNPYVRARPVVKKPMGDERYARLASRLVEVCNNQ